MELATTKPQSHGLRFGKSAQDIRALRSVDARVAAIPQLLADT